MKREVLVMVLSLVYVLNCFGQEDFYDVNAGEGNGIRLWSGDAYKIHMGNSSIYHYGPVNDYSIKTNMTGTAGRGWTWGVLNQEPIAALSNKGEFAVEGTITNGRTHLTEIELATHTWSASHGVLFNAYKDISQNGSLLKEGNTKFTNEKGSYSAGAGAIIFNANGGSMFFCISPASTGEGQDVDWNGAKMYLNREGQVGIGVIDVPDAYQFAVDGKALIEEITVENSDNWPDYVFEEDYSLTTLEETEAYIEANGHLPEVPAAEEMEANGVDLGEMNKLLLKKIEEMTLHMIEMNNQIKALQEASK